MKYEVNSKHKALRVMCRARGIERELRTIGTALSIIAVTLSITTGVAIAVLVGMYK